MNPTELRAESLRTFETLDLQLPDGCVAITGWNTDTNRSNGAGKSTVIEAVELALFGRSRTGAMSAQIPRGGDVDQTMVELVFEHRGELYRVRRSLRARAGASPKLDLEIAGGYEEADLRAGIETALTGTDPGLFHRRWEPLTLATAKETQQLLEQTIGYTRRTFRASAFLAQNDREAFTDVPPADRFQVLFDALGLDVYARRAEQAKARRKTADAERLRLEGETSGLRDVAAGLDATLEQHRETCSLGLAAEKTLAVAEERYRLVTERYQTAKEAAAVAKAAVELLAARQQAVEENERRTQALITRGSSIEAELHEKPRLEALAAQVPALEQRWTEHGAAVAEFNRVTVERSRLLAEKQQADAALLAAQARLTALDETEHVTCEACGQTVGDTATLRATLERATVLAGVQVVDLTEKLAALTVAPAPEPVGNLEHDLRTARAAGSRAGQLAAQEQEHARLVADLAALEHALPALIAGRDEARAAVSSAATVNVSGLAAEQTEAEGLVTMARASLDYHRSEKAKLEERLERIRDAETRVAASEARTNELAAQLDVLHHFEKVFGRNGIPAWYVEARVIPYLETEASTVLAELGTTYQVKLPTMRASKTTDTVRDTLDVLVVDNNAECAVETFSGGEGTTISLALRFALAEFLATQANADSRMLIVDEPSYLDGQGMRLLADVIRDRVNRGVFRKAYLVSHHPDLRDAFDASLEVVKENGRSRIVGAPVTEAVAA